MDATYKRTLAQKDGFRYEVATEKHGNAIVSVLIESFCREPIRHG
jgi:hypothetical protein